MSLNTIQDVLKCICRMRLRPTFAAFQDQGGHFQHLHCCTLLPPVGCIPAWHGKRDCWGTLGTTTVPMLNTLEGFPWKESSILQKTCTSFPLFVSSFSLFFLPEPEMSSSAKHTELSEEQQSLWESISLLFLHITSKFIKIIKIMRTTALSG